MFAICVESSHQRGMGHLFRALNLSESLKDQDQSFIVFINEDEQASNILQSKKIPFETVDLNNYKDNWEYLLIKKYGITIWINDRLNTDIRHSEKIRQEGITLVTFDDRGSGAELANCHFAALTFEAQETLKGEKIFTGLEYLILNDEIRQYRRLRRNSNNAKIIVTLGGSDTYGVTVSVVKALKERGLCGTIVTGPSFQHSEALNKVIDKRFKIKKSVPSLIKEFSYFDIAVTGGGITPFEANASGLPCIIVANELSEIPIGRFLDQLGSSVFAGYYSEMDLAGMDSAFDVEKMSHIGMHRIPLNGVDNIYREIVS